MLNLVDQSDWVYPALCRGQDPIQWVSADANYTDQRSPCARCPVKEQCLAYALGQGDSLRGYWGGTDERERRELRRQVACLGIRAFSAASS